ncbi:MAG: CocE/NonD family hydrolase [Pseudomonadota bacterium]
METRGWSLLCKSAWTGLLLFLTVACTRQVGLDPSEPEIVAEAKVSAFGRYEGYSTPRFNQFVRHSLHVPMRDGVRLAVDIYRPAINGEAVDTPLPVVFSYGRYRRAEEYPDGSISTDLGRLEPGENTGTLTWSYEHGGLTVPHLVAHGYVYARADERGTGASFGIYPGQGTFQQSQDGYDLVEWLAEQSFSTGKVGMIGGSYLGQSQFITMSEAPPSLAATFPQVAYFDNYHAYTSNGVARKAGFLWFLDQARSDGLLEDGAEEASEVARVDIDADGDLLRAAYAERREASASSNPMGAIIQQVSPEFAAAIPNIMRILDMQSPIELMALFFGPTDVLAERLEDHPELAQLLSESVVIPRESMGNPNKQFDRPNNLFELLPSINKSNIPVYNYGGWRDGVTESTVFWQLNLTNPSKLVVGPWTHGANEPGDLRENAAREILSIERLRWFDYWLKGIDNGIMDEPAVNYAVPQSPTRWEWRQASSWPVQGALPKRFYFANGPSESIESVNDGLLSMSPPEETSAHQFTVNYSATMGRHDRFHDSVGFGPMQYPDLEAHALSALTYTSPALESHLTIVGHPVVHLKATSTAADGDFFVYLQEVDAEGTVHYLTEGVIRASHRVIGDPPYDYLGMPWSDSSGETIAGTPPLDGTPESLPVVMKPIANHFETGHRIRVVVAGADSFGGLTMPRVPTPTQTLFLGGAEASSIELPILSEIVESD